MNRKYLIKAVLVLAFFILVLFTGYFLLNKNNKQAPVNKDKFRVQIGWIPNGEYAFICSAIVNGYYDAKNLDVEIVPGGPSGANFIVATPTIAQDPNLDIGIESDLVPILHGVAKDNEQEILKVKAIAAFWNDVPLGFLVRQDSGMTSLKDLGKPMKNGEMPKIGVTADFVLQDALANYAGVSQDKLNFVTTSFDATPFIANQVDALAGFWPNQAYEVEKAGIEYNFLNISELPNFRQVSMIVVATDQKLSEKREQIQRFIEATQDGVQFVIDNPDEAAKQILDSRCGGDKLDINQETWLIKKSLPLYENSNGYGNLDVEKITDFAKAFYDLKQIPFIPTPSSYLDTSFYQ